MNTKRQCNQCYKSLCNTCKKKNKQLLAKKYYTLNKKKISIRHKKYYLLNKEKIDEYVKLKHRKNKKEMYAYLQAHGCIDCGEKDIRVLEFDHVYGKPKYNISTLAGSTKWSSSKLQKEIAKCQVRCANCHKRRHFNESRKYAVL